jgi:transcriptional regulator with XRE-family HTH domain
MTQTSLAARAQVSRGYISRLEAGDFYHPSAALLLRIAHALDLDMAHLWDDIANARAPRIDEPTLEEMADQLLRLSQVVGQLRGMPVRAAGSAGKDAQPAETTKGRKAEDPRLVLEDLHVPPRRWALRVDDHALEGDDIREGDYVIVDPDLTLQEGQLVVARVHEDLLIEPQENSVMLEAPDAEILGVVYAVVRVLVPQSCGTGAGRLSTTPREAAGQRGGVVSE